MAKKIKRVINAYSLIKFKRTRGLSADVRYATLVVGQRNLNITNS